MTGSETVQLNQSQQSSRQKPLVLNTGRGVALFFSCFAMLNLSGELFHKGFDASVWWIDLRVMPNWISNTLMLLFSLLLFGFVCKPVTSKAITTVRKIIVSGAILIAVRDALTFHTLLNRDVIASQFPLPFSLVVAALLLLILIALHVNIPTRRTSIHDWGVIAATAAFCLVSFPLLQIQCFGWTDYRRPADAAVVFGCKVYSNGNLSTALADRVRSASDLYHQRMVSHLIMSGGPGMGDTHETDAMRDYAVDLGVPVECILTDRLGLSTDETAANTVPLFRKHSFARILAVSHLFHLPRIKLT